jgi:hypothetical protein
MAKTLVPAGMLPLAVAEGATTPAPSSTAVAWSTVLGCPVYWDGTRWTAGQVGRAVASAGLKMLIIGASTESRANPMWSGAAVDFVRSGGVVTCTVGYSLSNYFMLPGTEIRVACLKNPGVEGTFAITSCTLVANTSMTFTYPDPRPDIAAGALGGGFDVHLPSAYTVSAGWPMHANLCMGGRLEIDNMAVSGSNLIEDWGAARLDAMAAKGRFDIIMIGTGVIGNTIRAYGAGPIAAFNALKALIEAIRDRCNPRLILVETPSASRDIVADDVSTGPVFTTAQLLLRRMWTELPRLYPFVRVVPCVEAMVQNYSAFDTAPSSDVLNAWPESAALSSDNVHPAYGWSALRGEVVADTLLKHAAPHISPEMGVLPDSNQVATRLDPEGGKIRNYSKGLWGNVAADAVTLADTGVSGPAPAGATASFTAGRGSSTAVSSLGTDPRGGAFWRTVISGSGSSAGYTFRQDYSPSWLLAALNDPDINGQYVELFWPMTLQCNENKLIFFEAQLAASSGGTEYLLGGPMLNRGQFGQAAIGRGVDAGFSGVMRSPRIKIPPAVYTAASLRVFVKEVNGSVASGRTVVTWGAGLRFQKA